MESLWTLDSSRFNMWWPEHAQETPHWGQLSRQGALMYHRKDCMFQTDQDLGRSFWLGSASQGLPLQFSRRESKVGFWKVYSIGFVLPSTLSCPRIYGVCSRMYQAVQLAWCAATLLSEGTRLHSFYSRVSWRCCISCTTCVHLAQVIYCKSHIMAAAPLPNTSEPPAKRARKQHAILKSLADPEFAPRFAVRTDGVVVPSGICAYRNPAHLVGSSFGFLIHFQPKQTKKTQTAC